MTQGLRLVEVEADGVRVSATSPMTHQCPFADETDHGTAHLSWVARGQTVELHSLQAWLAEFAPVMVSHEALTTQLWVALSGLGLEGVRVTTTWTTAGMDVQVHAE